MGEILESARNSVRSLGYVLKPKQEEKEEMCLSVCQRGLEIVCAIVQVWRSQPLGEGADYARLDYL